MAKKRKDLAQIIRDNPGCIATIDNDSWTLRKPGEEPDFHRDWDAEEKWLEEHTLAHTGDSIVHRGSGYGSGNCYGGDILQALAVIVGIKIESV